MAYKFLKGIENATLGLSFLLSELNQLELKARECYKEAKGNLYFVAILGDTPFNCSNVRSRDIFTSITNIQDDEKALEYFNLEELKYREKYGIIEVGCKALLRGKFNWDLDIPTYVDLFTLND